MHLNTRSKAIGRKSFCARHNHRDFLTISWNIWAICLRDETPDEGKEKGGLTARFILSFFFLFPTRCRVDIRDCTIAITGSFIATKSAKIASISGINEFLRNGWIIIPSRNTPHDSRLSRNNSFAPPVLLRSQLKKNWECVRIISGGNHASGDLYVIIFTRETSCEQSLKRRKSTERNLIIKVDDY